MRTRSRTGLIVLTALAAAGPGCAGATSTMHPDGGRDSASDAGAQDGIRTDSYVPTCTVQISPVSPSTFNAPVAGEGHTLRVLGTAQGNVSGGQGFWWTVLDANGSPIATTFPQTGRDNVIELPITAAGTYTISVTVRDANPTCQGSLVVTAVPPGASGRATYQAMLTPPGASGYPTQTFTFQLLRGVPSSNNLITLLAGLTVTVLPVDENDQPLTGYVRLTRKDTGDYFEQPAGQSGATFQIPSATYDVLVVPDGDRAPQLFPDQRSDQLDGKKLTVTPGEVVSGDLKLPDGGAVEGARVVLRAAQDTPGDLPSTVATSNAEGRFALHARRGAWALAINPRTEHGLPQVLLPQAPGVQVASGGTQVRFEWSSPAPRPVTVKVANGSAAVAGARVVIEATAGSLDASGTLTVGTGTPLVLNGTFHAEAITGGDGTASLPGVPTAVYEATAVPPPAGDAAAVTVLSPVSVTATGTNSFDLLLQQKVTVTGKVLPADGIESSATGGAHVLLVDHAADVTFPTLMATVDPATNLFSLAVNPSRLYTLVVLPSSPALVGRAVLASYSSGTAATVTLPDAVIPGGLLYAGVVKDEKGKPVPGTIIRFRCLSCGIADPALPQTVSADEGAFSITLPQP